MRIVDLGDFVIENRKDLQRSMEKISFCQEAEEGS